MTIDSILMDGCVSVYATISGNPSILCHSKTAGEGNPI